MINRTDKDFFIKSSGQMALLMTLFLVLINIFNNITTNSPKAEGLTAIEIWMLACILFVFGMYPVSKFSKLKWQSNHFHKLLSFEHWMSHAIQPEDLEKWSITVPLIIDLHLIRPLDTVYKFLRFKKKNLGSNYNSSCEFWAGLQVIKISAYVRPRTCVSRWKS